MTEGVEIFTDTGEVILDHNLKNLFVRAQGTETSVTNTASQFGGSMVDISYTGSASSLPLCAPYLTTTGVMLWQTNRVGNTWTWTYIVDGAVGTDVDYYIFDQPPASIPAAGLEVYNAAGALTFASYAKPLRIYSVEYDTIVGLGYANSWSYIAGRKYAPIIGRFATAKVVGLGSGGFGTQAMHAYGVMLRGGITSILAYGFNHSTGINGTYTSADEEFEGDYQMLAVDLTDY